MLPKNTPKTLNLRQMIEEKNNNSVQDQRGNSTKTTVSSCDGCEWQISYDRNRLCPICRDYEYNKS